MIKLLVRIVMLLFGAASLIDAGLPVRHETLKVDQHTSSGHSETNAGGSGADTSYTLHFLGGQIASCSVGYWAYGRVKDGETVSVSATKLFKTCIRIAKGDEVIETDKYWRLYVFIGGLLLLATAFGWIEPDDDTDSRSW